MFNFRFISDEICIGLKNGGEINDNTFKAVMINVLSNNHDRIYKHYDTLSQNGLKEFTIDIIEVLDSECSFYEENIER